MVVRGDGVIKLLTRNIATLLFVASVTSVCGAEDHPGDLPELLTSNELTRDGLEMGASVRVIGKYKERIDAELYLFDCPVPFLLATRKLSRDVLEFTPTQDNLELHGTVVEHYGEPAIKIERIGKGPDDISMFRRSLEQVQDSDEPKATPLFALAKQLAVYHAREDNTEIFAFTKQVLDLAYSALVEEKPNDSQAQLEFAQKVDDLLDKREITTRFLLQIGTKFEQDAAVKAKLKSFRCRKYGGRWVTYEDFKVAEGLVFHRDSWMLPEEKHLLVALAAFLRRGESSLLLLRKRTEREYEIMASSGRAEPGMNRREVHAALGFPDNVRRKGSDGREFDQWSYDNEHYYFFNGILVQAPTDEKPQE